MFGGHASMHLKKSDTETVADKVCNASQAARESLIDYWSHFS